MYVGVILHGGTVVFKGYSIPHVCGGDPRTISEGKLTIKYSPCMWG